MSESEKPLRMCIICRNRFSKAALVRHVLDNGGNLVADEKQKSPGRGWYCCHNPGCMARISRFRPKLKRQS